MVAIITQSVYLLFAVFVADSITKKEFPSRVYYSSMFFFFPTWVNSLYNWLLLNRTHVFLLMQSILVK